MSQFILTALHFSLKSCVTYLEILFSFTEQSNIVYKTMKQTDTMNPLGLKAWDSQTDGALKSKDWQYLKYTEACRVHTAELPKVNWYTMFYFKIHNPA